MTEISEILIKQLDHQWMQARHSEDQRTATTRLILILTLAIEGFILQKGFVKNSIIFSVIMGLLGIYGAILSSKYYERFRLHTCRVGRLMEKLETLYPDANLKELEEKADNIHITRHPRMYQIRLHILWSAIYLGILATALINIIIIIVKWNTGI